MPDRMEIYHHLPYPLRVIGASLWGLYLRSWRYGCETDRLIEEALDRESWTAGQWKKWQEERLSYVLNRAATQVPYYQAYWQERRRKGDRSAWDILKNWPILSKETLRLQQNSFLAADCDSRKMYADHTSGTTGTPLSIWLNRSTVKQWYAIYEARIRQWHNVSIKQPWGIFGGQMVVPYDQKRPPFWVKNFSLNQTYFSVLHIAPWSSQAYIDEIKRGRLTHLVAYTNSLYIIASEVPIQQRPIKSDLKVIFTNAEPLYDFQRKVLEDVFACPIRETYGLAETVCAASECEQGNLHWWPEIGIPEIINDEGNLVQPGETGRLISTGLLNPDMPLIRYDTKDLSIRISDDRQCDCGRSLPLAGKFIGRYDDVIITKDGRKLTQLDTIFDPHLPLKEAQIVQNTVEDFIIRVVPDKGWTTDNANYLINALKRRVGNVNVQVTEEEQIERTWAGKFRIIVSKLSK